jgi:polysaccharide pyruvyl transferase WcaK-like protein
MKIFTIGDVGVKDGTIHVGDEAMLEELLRQLRSRGTTEATVVSSNPADTAARYGVKAVSPIDFSSERARNHAEREARMVNVLRAAHGETGIIDWQDPAWPVIEAIMGADAVVIAGGGNMSSIWPAHIYERATIGQLAAFFGKPLAISGQSLGPALLKREGELLAQLLKSAKLVGVRETSSHELAVMLGVEAELIRHTIDDATFLGVGDQYPSGPIAQPYCLVTFASDTGSSDPSDFADAAAALLDHVVAVTDLEVLLLAHVASVTPEASVGDDALHRLVLDRTTSGRVRMVSADSPKLAAEYARRAQLSISTRYHPTVFATGAGVPAIGVTVDEYTDNKIAGALENFGQSDHLVPAVALFSGDAKLVVDDVWEQRAAIRASAAPLARKRALDAERWWDDLAATLRGGTATAYTWEEHDSDDRIDGSLRKRLDGLREWMRQESRRATGTSIAVRGLTEHMAVLESDTAKAENLAAAAQSELDAALERGANAEASLSAAQALAQEVADPLFARRLAREPAVPQTTDIQTLMDTKLFRWSGYPRRVYGHLRRELRR